ncbi:DsbC family protein [Marinobacter sp.]|uniref:DsbC family protein n=1 Tax=Marinobacter sp. TaxID=50741 RepID=UPI00384AC71B
MTFQKLFCRLALTLALVPAVFLATPVMADDAEDAVRERIEKQVPRLTIASVRPAPAPGLYEVVTSGGEVIYATEGGEYLLTGDLLQLTDSGISNVTESGRAAARADVLDEFGEKGLISYPAKGDEKTEIAVFTDIDCPYCRKFHNEIGRLNELGITVHYYAFPRSGPNTPSFSKYESVWCAEDSRAAMDAAKQGRNVDQKTCETPVRAQFELGSRVGVTGTPAIVLEDGKMVRGYVPADELARGLGLL